MAKIVYYGPGLSGKTTNLQYIFSVTNPKSRGELISIETDIERTLFFDLLPMNVGLVSGYQTKFQLYTVPGQVFYDSTRRLVLKGADGIVFVADSQPMMESPNLDSFLTLKENLTYQNLDISGIPLVFQFNKRDLKNISSIEKMNKVLNNLDCPYFSAIAIKGTGVIETLREISSLTLKKIKELMTQSRQKEDSKTFVNFDMDKKHEIIKKEELPFKKISASNIKDFSDKALVEKEDKKTFKEKEEIFDLEEFEEIEELGGFEESNEFVNTEIDIDTLETGEDTNEFEEPEIIEKAEEIKELEELMELKEKEEVEEPVIIEKAEKVKELEEPMELKEKEEVEEPVIIEKAEEVKKNVKTQKPSTLDFLENLKDNSRMTIIKKIEKLPKNGSSIIIEVKDKDSALLKPIEMKITPKTKKITLILDVKK